MKARTQVAEDWCHGCGKRTSPFVIVTIYHDAENQIVDPVREFRLCLECADVITYVATVVTRRAIEHDV